MDVRVEISLLGGHAWSFVCDENDPLVFGLVSALPGVAVDTALPSDGLIQVERRSGDRIYFTRSSLVSVGVFRDVSDPGGSPQPTLADLSQEPTLALEPAANSVVVNDVFRPAALDALRALRPKAPAPDDRPGPAALDDAGADGQVAEDMVRLAASARQSLMVPDGEETSLVVDFFRVGPGETVTFQMAHSDLLWLVVAIPETPDATVSFDLKPPAATEAPIGADAAGATRRLSGNSAYACRGGEGTFEVRADANGHAILIQAALRAADR